MNTSALAHRTESGLVSQRLAKAPRLASVALELLHPSLQAGGLTAASRPTLATGIWRWVDHRFAFTGYALRPLAQAVYQRYLTDRPLDLAEALSFITLAPGSEYSERARVDQAALSADIDLAGSVLIDAWCDRLARYWSEPEEFGSTFWDWLADHLRHTLEQAHAWAMTNGQLSLREGQWVAEALGLARPPSALAPDNSPVQVRLLLQDPAPVPPLLIQASASDEDGLLYSPLTGFSRVEQVPRLVTSGERISEEEGGQPILTGQVFKRWACSILDRHLRHLRGMALALRREQAEPTLFEASMEAMPAATLLDHASHLRRSEALRRYLPGWLRQATSAQRLCYADGLKALIHAQAQQKGAPFLQDIPTADEFARQRLITEAARLHPDAPLAKPEDVLIHIFQRDDDALISLAGGGTDITLKERQISLVDLSLVNVGGRPPGWMTVSAKPGGALPAWLDDDAALELVSASDVGATYMAFLQQQLAKGSEAAHRRETYRTLAAVELPLLALELQLRKEQGIDERGVALVRQALSEQTSPVQTAVVSQLALQAAEDLPADRVAGAFILSAPSISDILVLYTPLTAKPLRQFTSREALLECIRAEADLQRTVLNGLSDAARPRYAHGGLQAPRWMRFGLGDEFAPLRSSRPARLVEQPVGGSALDAFYDSVVELITLTADRQTISNWESTWMTARQVGWLVFNQMLPLFSGTTATAAWLIQLGHAIDAQANDTGAETTQGADPVDGAQMLLDLMLALVTEGFHLTGGQDVGASTLREGWHDPELGNAPALDTGWAAAQAELTHAMREQLRALAVAAPAELPPPDSNGLYRGLYRVEGKWLVPLGDQWFEVGEAEGDIRVVDPSGSGRAGPWLRQDSRGQWQLDLRLRLRGGGPKRRIEQQREENQRLRAQAAEHLRTVEALYRGLRQVGEQVEARIKADLDSGRVTEATASRLAELARIEHAYQGIRKAREDYEAIHAKVALPEYHERLAMAVTAEINTCSYYLSLNRQALDFFLKAHPDFTEVLRDGSPMSLGQRRVWFEFLQGYVATAEEGVSWRTKLEGSLRRLEEIPVHGARWLERLKPKIATFRHLIEYQALRLYTYLSLMDAPMVEDDATLDWVHQALKPLVLALNTHKQMVLDPALGAADAKELLDGAVSAYQAAGEMLTVLKQSLRPEYVTSGMDRLQAIIEEQREAAQDWLGRLLRDAQREAPEVLAAEKGSDSGQRVIRTRNRGKLVARVRKKTGQPHMEVAEVISPLDDRVVARFEPDETEGDWVERPAPVRSQAPQRAQVDDLDRLAREADRRLQDAERQLAQAPRLAQATHIPIELEELMLGTGRELKALAERIERSLTRLNETDVRVERVQSAERKAHALRERAARLKREGRALRIRLTKMALPTIAHVRYLVEQGEAQVRRLGERVALKGQGKRKDIVQEYVIEEPRGLPLWYAHFHYANQAAADEDYLAAHLKTVSQRFVGLGQQMAQAANNAEVVKVYRSRIDAQSARLLFLNQP